MIVSHFIDEKIEAQKGQIICSGSHGQEVAKSRLEASPLGGKDISGRRNGKY